MKRISLRRVVCGTGLIAGLHAIDWFLFSALLRDFSKQTNGLFFGSALFSLLACFGLFIWEIGAFRHFFDKPISVRAVFVQIMAQIIALTVIDYIVWKILGTQQVFAGIWLFFCIGMMVASAVVLFAILAAMQIFTKN